MSSCAYCSIQSKLSGVASMYFTRFAKSDMRLQPLQSYTPDIRKSLPLRLVGLFDLGKKKLTRL